MYLFILKVKRIYSYHFFSNVQIQVSASFLVLINNTPKILKIKYILIAQDASQLTLKKVCVEKYENTCH